MNYIKHLTGFFEKVVADKTLNPTHISLYIALFQFWNCNRFKNPISISRDELMRISKISSKATYHKCLRNLHESGYINYQPSYNPFKGSHVIMFNFSEILKPQTKADRTPINEPISDTSAEQVVNKPNPTCETSTEQAVVSYINNTNSTNSTNKVNNSNIEKSLNKSQQAKMNEISKPEFFDMEASTEKEKKLREKKKDQQENFDAANTKQSPVKNHFILPGLTPLENNNNKASPTIQEVQEYFTRENFPDIEAQKFHNYFSSIGWLVGGRTPMQNWKAAAQNWIINSINFKDSNTNTPTNRPQNLNASTDKNYAEPL